MKLSQERYDLISPVLNTPRYYDTNPKIDFYVDGIYAGSTCWHRRVAHAIAHYHNRTGVALDRIQACKD